MDKNLLLWIALAAYGAAMWFLAPRAQRFDQFFVGRSAPGRDVGMGFLIASIVISWIFAKSITNASNLGRSFGMVGAVAYAGWYLSIPVAGVVIYRLRTRFGAKSLPGLVTKKYGPLAALSFLLVILFRLVNEVWSNTAVVGAYFGASGTASYFAAALAFTGVTLLYSLRGGLRSSIVTDALQFALGAFLLAFVLGLIFPKVGPGELITTGEWSMVGGVDLLLVAILQSFSYPFHDPVLTDRGFLTHPSVMLKSYLVAGVLAGAFIVLFGMTGIYGQLVGLEAGQDAPIRVAEAFGVASLAGMTILMMVSAGSTLDSTLSSFSKAFVVDLGGATEERGLPEETPIVRAFSAWMAGQDPIHAGRIVMVLAVVLGSLPLFAGATILKATTVSGTMVLGLAPIFLLIGWRSSGPLAFHMALWPGVLLGILHAANAIPAEWAIGDGKYGTLLGANLYGTGIVFAGYAVGGALDRVSGRQSRRAASDAVAEAGTR